MFMCMEAFQSVMEGVLADISLKMDNERKYSTRAPRDMISPLFDATLHKMSRTKSEVSNGVYASGYAPAGQYVRRRHQSQDGTVLESKYDSSFRLNSRLAMYQAPHAHFHYKKA